MGCSGSKTTENTKEENKTNTNKAQEPGNNQKKESEKNNVEIKKEETHVDKKEENHVEVKKEENHVNVKKEEKPASNNQINSNAKNTENNENKDKAHSNKNVNEEVEDINQDDSLINDDDVIKKTPLVVFGIFPPGVNKYRVLKEPLDILGFHAISTKELIEKELANEEDSEIKETIKLHVEKKSNIPGEIVTNLILSYIKTKQHEGINRFFVSGFPRSEDNSKTWKNLASDVKVIALIFISYTKNEYNSELDAEEDILGKKFDREAMESRFYCFITNTNSVFDDFGKKRCIKLSATLSDDIIRKQVFKNGLFKKIE